MTIEVENFKVRARNTNNTNLHFVKDGIVHEPELFEAVMKSYHIDCSDFVINTEEHERSLEPHYNFW